MKKLLVLLWALLALNLTHAQTQIQNARVKTRGRMVDGQYIPGKGLPGTVVSIEGITDIGVRNSNGTFSFPVEDNNYYVKSVAKNEYALLDSDAAPKFYNYSEDTLYFVMEQPEQMYENLLETKDKIRKTLERELANAKAEIIRVRDENKIPQEEYLRKLQQLISNQEENEDLVNEMAKRSSTLDYDQLDAFYRQVNNYIEEGELTKADSLLRSRGDIRKQIDNHRKSEYDYAFRCYTYSYNFWLQHQYDSAASYIELRADLDLHNINWQTDAGTYFYHQKQYPKAKLYYTRSLDIARSLYKENPRDNEHYVANALNNLACLYSVTKHYDESEQMLKESLEIYLRLSEDNPQIYDYCVSETFRYMGELYKASLQYSKSETAYKKSIEIKKNLFENNSLYYESALAGCLYDLGVVYMGMHQYSDSEQMYKESLEICKKLYKNSPRFYERLTADNLYGLALLYYNINSPDESEQSYKEALVIYRRLSEDNPQVYDDIIAAILTDMANLYCLKQCYSDGERSYKEALAIFRRLSEDTPQVYDYYVVATLNNLAALYNNTKRYSESEDMYKESLEIYRRLSVDNCDLNKYHSGMSDILHNLAILYMEIQRYSESELLFQEALEIRRKLSEDNQIVYEPYLAATLYNLGNLYFFGMQRYDESEKLYKEAMEILYRLSGYNPHYEQSIVVVLINMANLYFVTQNYNKSIEMYEESIEIMRNLSKESIYTCEMLIMVLGDCSYLCLIMQEFSKAEQYAREGIEVDPTQTFFYSNLASSLLFQGKYKEAEKIYKQYKTELKDAFLSNFKQFEEAGIIPKKYKSDVEKIKQLLNE